MTAAAQRLHDHLHIHGAHAAGRDVYPIAHLHCHKAGVHALNAQQVVGGLRNGDPGLRGEVGMMVGTKTTYVEGLHMSDAGIEAYKHTVKVETEKAVNKLGEMLK